MTDDPHPKPDKPQEWGATSDIVLPGQKVVSAVEMQKLPQQLGRYILIERLGAGGMAEVFLANQDGPSGFAKKVVIKRIHSHLARDQRFVEMFKREALLVARLNHQNVVQVYELGEEEGIYFIAMEYVDGLSLLRLARRAWTNRRSVPMEVVVGAIADAAFGLHHAHELRGDDGKPLGIVHRDISPENLMINRDGTTKVLDFGIARGHDTSGITKTGELKGKLPFMSPEQMRGDPLDGRSDLYSLGVTLYWLLTGRLPLTATSELMLLQAVLTETPRQPSEINARVPRVLEELCMQLLEKDPERRPRHGVEVYERLAPLAPVRTLLAAPYVENVMTWVDEEGTDIGIRTDGFVPSEPQTSALSEWRPPTASTPPLPIVPVTRDAEEPGELEPAPSKKLPMAAIIGVAIGLAVVAGVAIAISGGPDPEETGPLPPPPIETGAGSPPSTQLGTAGQGTVVEPVEPAVPVAPVVPPPATDEPGVETVDPKRKQPRRDPVAEKPRVVEVKGPAHVKWLGPNGKALGSGSGSLTLPPGTRSITAYDSRRGAKTRMPVADDIDYASLPKGTLDIRALPYAKVVIGGESFGVTPFAPLRLVVGSYTVKLIYEGKTETRHVEIAKDRIERITADFRGK